MFDGAGFVRGVERKGRPIAGRARWSSAAAASAAPSRPRSPPPASPRIGLFDANAAAAEALGARLRAALPAARGHDRLQGPRRLRHRGQRDAAGHERRRPAAAWMSTGIDPDDLRRRGRDEAGDHARSCAPPRPRAARSRSAPTCCSSRSRPISSSSAFPPPRPRSSRRGEAAVLSRQLDSCPRSRPVHTRDQHEPPRLFS